MASFIHIYHKKKPGVSDTVGRYYIHHKEKPMPGDTTGATLLTGQKPILFFQKT